LYSIKEFVNVNSVKESIDVNSVKESIDVNSVKESVNVKIPNAIIYAYRSTYYYVYRNVNKYNTFLIDCILTEYKWTNQIM